MSAMKIMNKFTPKQLFRLKKTRSVTRADPASYSYGSSSSDSTDSSSIHKPHLRKSTPTSVLRSRSAEISEISADLSDISSDVYSDVVQAFKMIDKDGDGKITRKQLGALLSRVGTEPASEEELTMMLSEIDRDGDGCITLEEFSAIGSAFGPAQCDSELRDAFDFFDADHDGRITAEELQSVFAAIGDDSCTVEDCRRMISGVNKNGDGFVCFEDFTRMMGLQRVVCVFLAVRLRSEMWDEEDQSIGGL
ncbi:putative calcium-binding protein CML36 [Camellia lanceoleosa]|uniref:Calcium-binding protein CML36 n=1 Tax=Camellia lanceoleosa TaxID=1840588 RepID=A0ACC0GBR6_9ERIC|nr:putative calcium-binding protein CML36 [Camellia lanceoleosa]